MIISPSLLPYFLVKPNRYNHTLKLFIKSLFFFAFGILCSVIFLCWLINYCNFFLSLEHFLAQLSSMSVFTLFTCCNNLWWLIQKWNNNSATVMQSVVFSVHWLNLKLNKINIRGLNTRLTLSVPILNSKRKNISLNLFIKSIYPWKVFFYFLHKKFA